MLGVCISVSSVSPCLAGLHAEAAEMPGIQEIVDANNFVAYCDLYDSIYMDYQSKEILARHIIPMQMVHRFI